jgi:hypothetical protein
VGEASEVIHSSHGNVYQEWPTSWNKGFDLREMER